MQKILLFTVCFAFLSLQSCAQNNKSQNMSTKKILIAYFSCTGTTEQVAKMIAQQTDADLYEIAPKQPYTSADLDWTNKKSRSTVEMNDPKDRPAIGTAVKNMNDYDVVFIGFPIWWYTAPHIINTFMESYDFKGKTIIPFATSGSSPIAPCVADLKKAYPAYTWQEGKLLNAATDTKVAEWVKTLTY